MGGKKERLQYPENTWDDIQQRANRVASVMVHIETPQPDISAQTKAVLTDGLKLSPQDVRAENLDPYYAWQMVYDALANTSRDNFSVRVLSILLKNVKPREEASTT